MARHYKKGKHHMDCRPKKYRGKRYVFSNSHCSKSCFYWEICGSVESINIHKELSKDEPKLKKLKEEYSQIKQKKWNDNRKKIGMFGKYVKNT